MAAEPSDVDISSLSNICGIPDLEEARARLKANNNNIDAAIGDYFDGSKKYNSWKNSTNWDESPFGMSRDGTEQTQSANPSFRIDAMGDDVAAGGHSVAPSRPPSRVNSRTPVSNHGTIERWQQQTAAGADIWQNPSEAQGPDAASHNFPASTADEDADMQRAIEASRLEAGMPPQESGVTPAVTVNEVKFGPANRPDAEYIPDQWALVPSTFHESAAAANIGPVASNSTAVYEETASARIRKGGAPAFLMSTGPDKMPPLASILTILHEIPAARNALLGLGQPAPKYFHNSEWWRGASVEYTQQESPIHPFQEIAEETHRIMAFLDSTERSYGCIDPLLNTQALHPEADPLKGFCNVIQDTLDPETLRVLFSQVTQHFRVARPTWAAADETQEVSVVEYNPAGFAGEGFPPVLNLYDILNMVMWHQFIMNPQEDDDSLACIRDPGEVIVFRWQGSELENDIEVPEMIYIDRYLESNISGALAIQEGICAAAERLATIKKLKEAVYMEVLPNNKTVPKVDHYKRMIERCQAKLAGIDEDAAWRAADARWRASRERQKKGIEPTKEDLDPEKYKPRLTEDEEKRKQYWEKELSLFQGALEQCLGSIKKYEASVMFFEGIHSLVTDRYTGSTVAEMKGLLAHIKKQLVNAMGEENADRTIQYFEKLFPGTLDIEGWDDPRPKCKRLLRGVAVADKVVYVCKRPTALFNEGSEEDDEWWKLEYREDEADPVRAEIVDEMKVRVAAGKTKDRPILVYASPGAINATPDVLSEALSFFVKSDNHIFRNEVANEVPSAEMTVQKEPQPVACAPSKRKYSSGSMDSNATNRASCGGNSDIGDFQDQYDTTSPFFSAEDAEADQEMSVVMSAQGTPLRGVSSAIESPNDASGPDPPSAPRRRKTSDLKGDRYGGGGESEHIEYSSTWQEESQPPPQEMQSRHSIPLIGMGSGDNNASLRNGNSSVDIMSMDIHEHED